MRYVAYIVDSRNWGKGWEHKIVSMAYFSNMEKLKAWARKVQTNYNKGSLDVYVYLEGEHKLYWHRCVSRGEIKSASRSGFAFSCFTKNRPM